MARYSKRLWFPTVVFAMMGVLLISGCSSGGAAFLENPLDFFEQAQGNMLTVESYRIRGEMLTDYGDIGDSGITIEYDMAYELKSDGEMLVKMNMVMDMEGDEIEVLAYVTEGGMYLKMPGGIWVFQDSGMLSGMEDISQSMSPMNMVDILGKADSAEVVEEDGDSITYRLVFDVERMLREHPEVVEDMREDIEDEGVPVDDVDAFIDTFMEMMFSSMDYVITFDKESSLATYVDIRIDMDLSLFADLFPEDSLEGTAMTMDADFEFSDYGKAFNLELPEEAEDAIPMEELEESLQK